MILTLILLLAQLPQGEEPVAPYAQANANAGARPFAGDAMFRAFHGQAGVDRIVDDFIARNVDDARIGDIFKGQDFVRLHRVLKEHFCYVLGGGCAYTGRTMKDAHKDMGLQAADMGALVENLQAAMRAEGVPFAAQNRLLAKLAPIKRDVVER
ncbi:group 1 truncated hemoglobin [Sphingomonas sp.]|uniref:group I truncated hemoglobin n=1 Tax=Sphingomonas sp. TaxID=28214 RepID=UPI0035BC1B08